MIIILAALLMGISVSCLCLGVSHHFQSRNVLAERLTNVTKSHVETSHPPSLLDPFKGDHILSLEESYKDPIARALYLGGKRTKKDVRFFHTLLNLSIILPIGWFVMNFAMGTITPRSLLQGLMIGGVLFIWVRLLVKMIKQRRGNLIMRSMPQFFDLLVICLEAGVNFTGALPRVIQEMGRKDVLAQEFETMHHEFIAGLPFAETCERLGKRCEVQDLSVIMNALIESEKLGSSLSGVLRIQAAELRDKLRQRAREKAHKIPVKLLFPMLIIFSTMFVIVLGPVGNKLSTSISKGTERKKVEKPERPERKQAPARVSQTRQK